MDHRGHTALMSASCSGALEVLQVLLKAGADPNLQRQQGASALMLAAERGYTPLAAELLRFGANPNLSISPPSFLCCPGHSCLTFGTISVWFMSVRRSPRTTLERQRLPGFAITSHPSRAGFQF